MDFDNTPTERRLSDSLSRVIGRSCQTSLTVMRVCCCRQKKNEETRFIDLEMLSLSVFLLLICTVGAYIPVSSFSIRGVMLKPIQGITKGGTRVAAWSRGSTSSSSGGSGSGGSDSSDGKMGMSPSNSIKEIGSLIPSTPKEVIRFNRLVRAISAPTRWTQFSLTFLASTLLIIMQIYARQGSGQLSSSVPPPPSSLSSSSVSSLFLNSLVPMSPMYLFTLAATFLSFLNCMTALNISRVSRKIALVQIEPLKVVPLYRSNLRMAITISFIGIMAALVRSLHIVATLVARMLSTHDLRSIPGILSIGLSTIVSGETTLRNKDILLLFANTNVIVALFVPLISYLYLSNKLPQTLSLPVSSI